MQSEVNYYSGFIGNLNYTQTHALIDKSNGLNLPKITPQTIDVRHNDSTFCTQWPPSLYLSGPIKHILAPPLSLASTNKERHSIAIYSHQPLKNEKHKHRRETARDKTGFERTLLLSGRTLEGARFMWRSPVATTWYVPNWVSTAN